MSFQIKTPALKCELANNVITISTSEAGRGIRHILKRHTGAVRNRSRFDSRINIRKTIEKVLYNGELYNQNNGVYLIQLQFKHVIGRLRNGTATKIVTCVVYKNRHLVTMYPGLNCD